MALKELGIALREAREAKNLDIEDVAIRIKVSARVLRAIEDGERDGLPHAVYARGFIKSYASLLGVDNDLVMRAVDEAYPFEVPEDLLPETVVAQPPVRARTGLPPVVLALAALVLLAALGGGWYYRQQSSREAEVPKVAQPAQSAQPAQPVQPEPQVAAETPSAQAADADPTANATALANATAPAAAAVAVNATSATPSASSSPAAQPSRNATAPAAAASAAPATANPTVAAPASAPTVPTAQATSQSGASQSGAPQGGVFDSEAAAGEGADTDGSVLAGGTHRIVVIALADCWVHSSADDSDVRQFSLHKGQTFALTFSKRLTLKLGNAGGVRIRYNGQEQPAPGDAGQVRTLVFPPQAQ